MFQLMNMTNMEIRQKKPMKNMKQLTNMMSIHNLSRKQKIRIR